MEPMDGQLRTGHQVESDVFQSAGDFSCAVDAVWRCRSGAPINRFSHAVPTPKSEGRRAHNTARSAAVGPYSATVWMRVACPEAGMDRQTPSPDGGDGVAVSKTVRRSGYRALRPAPPKPSRMGVQRPGFLHDASPDPSPPRRHETVAHV